MSQNARVKMHKSYGSVWQRGDLIAGFRKGRLKWDEDEFSVVLCVEARELGSGGGVLKPAQMAEITGPSWASVCRAVQSLGFKRPSLTATAIRRELTPRDRERLAADLRGCRETLADNVACLRALRRLGPPHVPWGSPEMSTP